MKGKVKVTVNFYEFISFSNEFFRITKDDTNFHNNAMCHIHQQKFFKLDIISPQQNSIF